GREGGSAANRAAARAGSRAGATAWRVQRMRDSFGEADRKRQRLPSVAGPEGRRKEVGQVGRAEVTSWCPGSAGAPPAREAPPRGRQGEPAGQGVPGRSPGTRGNHSCTRRRDRPGPLEEGPAPPFQTLRAVEPFGQPVHALA